MLEIEGPREERPEDDDDDVDGDFHGHGGPKTPLDHRAEDRLEEDEEESRHHADDEAAPRQLRDPRTDVF